IELVNTALESTTSTGSVLFGRTRMPTKLKSRTTTNRRLPQFRPPTHPGEMLQEEFLKPLGLTQSEFAVRLGVSSPRLNELIRAKRGMTPDTALRLERVLGM